MNELTQQGIGQSTCIGIGGDPIIGTGFVDALELFEADPETEVVVLIGEIGGDDEEKAAAHIGEQVSKPVVAYVAGFTAPPGKRMGHAGAIITGSKGTAQAKAEAFEEVGVKVGRNPTEVAEIVASIRD
jgi:succinyl-CoA synthetase alpha subunit